MEERTIFDLIHDTMLQGFCEVSLEAVTDDINIYIEYLQDSSQNDYARLQFFYYAVAKAEVLRTLRFITYEDYTILHQKIVRAFITNIPIVDPDDLPF